MYIIFRTIKFSFLRPEPCSYVGICNETFRLTLMVTTTITVGLGVVSLQCQDKQDGKRTEGLNV